MRIIAIYDLDRTVLRHASFTPFLLFAARQRRGWRLALAPAWVAAMLLHKGQLLNRERLKQFGLRLFLGSRTSDEELAELGHAFAERILPEWLAPGAAAAMTADRADGCDLVLATAAMEFYALPIAQRLGFDDTIATRHAPLSRPGPVMIAQRNCYGAQKLRRIGEWLERIGARREECLIRFYSDSLSDAPTLRWADRAVLVDPGRSARTVAGRENWRVARFRK